MKAPKQKKKNESADAPMSLSLRGSLDEIETTKQSRLPDGKQTICSLALATQAGTPVLLIKCLFSILIFWSFEIVCDLVFGYWNFVC